MTPIWPPKIRHLSEEQLQIECTNFVNVYLQPADGRGVRLDDLFNDWIDYCRGSIILPEACRRREFRKFLRRTGLKVPKSSTTGGVLLVAHVEWRPDADSGVIWHTTMPLVPRVQKPLFAEHELRRFDEEEE